MVNCLYTIKKDDEFMKYIFHQIDGGKKSKSNRFNKENTILMIEIYREELSLGF